MKITEYFDSQKRESQKLVDELEKHMATWPEVDRQFNEIDAGECIPFARQWNDARAAGSPTQFKRESELKQSRWKRDGVKRRHQLERDRLHREIEKFTAEPIREFSEYALARLRNLSALYNWEKLDSFRNLEDRRVRFTIRISHNGAALRKCRDRILELKEEIWNLHHRPLAEIEKRIAEAKKEIEFFNLSTMKIEEVTEGRATELMRTEEPIISAGTVFVAPGVPNVFMKNPELVTPRLKALENKISSLEAHA